MLISKLKIQKTNPPFLLRSVTGGWTLVSKITETSNGLMLEAVERDYGEFVTRSIDLNEEPFSVGADIWELEYGTVLMTLTHQSLHDHPAQTLWKEWILHNNVESGGGGIYYVVVPSY